MSPRLAPESDEPNSAIACLSSSTSRALIGTFPRQIDLLDEAGGPIPNCDFDAAIGDLGHGGRHNLALLQGADGLSKVVTLQLLDTKADAFLLDIDVEQLHLHHIALLEIL